jgi:RNA-directed DNA polymerase
MAGESGPNHPDRRTPIDKVRQLQRRLWSAAKQQPGRRFHALYDRIARRDVLAEAWKRVRRNRGAAGVDTQTIADVERRRGASHRRWQLGQAVPGGAVLRRNIPKMGRSGPRDPDSQRPSGDGGKLVLEPIFEATVVSYGFRPAERDEALEPCASG